jgi:hypothetical protein
MNKEVKIALYKVGRLIIVTGGRLKRLSSRDPTLKDLNDIHETLIYCAEAISKIVDVMNEESA